MLGNNASTSTTSNKRAIVIGGSLGGLFAGNMLRSIGWEVCIYERSAHDLDSRGGGIVLQPDVVEVFRLAGINTASLQLGVDSRYRTVFSPDGSIQSKSSARQTQTSWSLIYSTMKQAFGDDHYHKGKKLVAIEQNKDSGTVTARFDDSSEATGDLLIGADGNGSTVRQLLWPGVAPTYAGYLAWRGLVHEREIPTEAADGLVGDFAFASHTGSHMLGYLVPGDNNDTREGHRYYNWVWYRTADDEQLKDIMTDNEGHYRGFSIPEGKLTERWVNHVYAEAEALLPPNFKAMVKATSQPFGQAIRDLTIDHMIHGHVVLLGDAAFIPRPHTAASTSKAAANAMALAAALDTFPENLDQALQHWEPHQLRLGNHLYQQGTQAGNHLLFRS